jgi:alkylation response protein AidB-like acyl-CoA dehydrogenase
MNPTPTRALDGHRPAEHPLSVRSAVAGAISVANYEPTALWEQDTQRLPRVLRSYRRRMRDFAREHLAPLALATDQAPHEPAQDARLLALAGREGLMTDLLPWPLGSRPLHQYVYPIQLLTCLKAEELCAACGGLGLFLSAHVLGTAPLLLTGQVGAIGGMLWPAYRRIQAGERCLFAFAITEPTAGSDVEDTDGAAQYRPGCVAKAVEGGFRITGRKIFISGGDLADVVLVFAGLENEGMESWTCFYVDTRSEGFRFVRNELKMGQRASGAAELELDSVFVPHARVVGNLRGGWALNRATLNFSRMPVGAIALGIARGAVEAAIDFCCRTQLCGKPLVDYQEVQLQIASMLAETTAMRAMIWHGASQWTPTQAMASMTKFHCGDRAVEVCNQAMDLLGNHAVLHGNRVEKAFRDSRLNQIYEGTNEINRLGVIEDIQEQLLAQVAAIAGA